MCLFSDSPNFLAGEGAFGNVKLVLHKPTGRAYALKCQGKQDIVDNELQVSEAVETLFETLEYLKQRALV